MEIAIVDYVISQAQVKGANSHNFYKLFLFNTFRCLFRMFSSVWPSFDHLNNLHSKVGSEVTVSRDGLSKDENVHLPKFGDICPYWAGLTW